jgi:GNAT superfamily N-acetyltransferase
VFAVTDRDLRMLGVVHVAFTGTTAELGLSVLPEARGQGVGNALFERAVMHLRTRGARSVFMHCLAENQTVIHLAHKNGMRIVHDGGESDAHLELEPPTAGTFMTEWMREQRADARETAKLNAYFTRRFLAYFSPTR